MMLAASALGYDIIEKPVVPKPEEADWGSLWTMPVSGVASIKKQIELCSIAGEALIKTIDLKRIHIKLEWV